MWGNPDNRWRLIISLYWISEACNALYIALRDYIVGDLVGRIRWIGQFAFGMRRIYIIISEKAYGISVWGNENGVFEARDDFGPNGKR